MENSKKIQAEIINPVGMTAIALAWYSFTRQKYCPITRMNFWELGFIFPTQEPLSSIQT